jgi:hypothetical protein
MSPIACLPAQLPKQRAFKDFGILGCDTMYIARYIDSSIRMSLLLASNLWVEALGYHEQVNPKQR